MKSKITVICLTVLGFIFSFATPVMAQSDNVVVEESEDGWKLLVDDEPLMVNGMNWDYFPRGTNFNYSLWNQSPEFIQQALDYEMGLLKNMGVNVIRVYTGIPKRWITYIYENYGIYTMLNHSFGRYGLTIDGAWMANTEYSDERVKELLLEEVTQLAEEYRDTPGLLLYLLGNENNYGLFWGGAETEDIPLEDRESTIRARAMYELFNEAAVEMKAIDNSRPIAMANGDLLFMDLVAELVPDMDIFGTNTYRGMTFTDLYERVQNEYGKPVLLTEFGSDRFNAQTLQEAQIPQATYLLSNWKDIYRNAAGLGGSDNSIGGFTFQFSDGWWKYGQTEGLDTHDTNASWENGGYEFDHVPGENNMNEEWFGIMAKGPTDLNGFYELYPTAAYYVLKEVHEFEPYEMGVGTEDLESHFSEISVVGENLRASTGGGSGGGSSDLISLSRFTAMFETYNTGGSKITTPDDADPDVVQYPDELGFDHMQSYLIGVEANPSPNMRAEVVANVLGNVAENPIDEIFYENRGRAVELMGQNGNVTAESLNRVDIYSASYSWNDEYFNLDGFYRTGHYHWGYEGDFFGLYPESNYGDQIFTYNGEAPFGFEAEGKKMLDGAKLAFGPQLWWGANPAVLLKYSRDIGQTSLTGIFHEDIERQGLTGSSFAIPQPKTRRLTLYAGRDLGNFGVELGGIWAGEPLNGREFQLAREQEDGGYDVYVDEIKPEDNWGGKLKLTYEGGRFNWYAQSAVMGLVAQGGADQTMTFTGWRLKDSGSGNQYNFLSGFTYMLGNIQVAPNFLWQKPIEGPIPSGVEAPARPRNILDDPFVVRANREQVAGELLLTYDPTPGTYMYEWDNDMAEDAAFAMSLGFVYRYLPTTQDAAIGILPDGRTFFPFPGAPPVPDENVFGLNGLWEVNARIVSKVNRDLGIIANLYGGEAQANGSDPRMITRFGGDLRMIYKQFKISSHVKVNDWGPYDYHRDFNLTFPLQLMADFSTDLGRPDWFDLPSTRIGVRGTWRSLDDFSPRYAPTYMMDPSGELVPDPTASGFDNGSEWEFRTYIQINLTN
ncbi:glycoside hydrolase family 2 TIM barrel-domain containing protein [Rhodohalobacter sp.]|uniref:glycoside hydrolase family 2 TIM barrel-domain containing protein n=1 Tax=Rhodohalobacter sp. TaxID=1974210 RepID=UPI003565B114